MADGILYPSDFILDECFIAPSSGNPLEFKHMVVELNYYEDIYSNCITGNMVINDSNGFLDQMEFSGNEFLYISFSKPGLEKKIQKVFRIYSVSNREQVKINNENYVLNFCSEELYLSQTMMISKAYPNTPVSGIVTDILNTLKVNSNKLSANNIEDTFGTLNLIVPKLHPFEAINWLCRYALISEAQEIGAPFFFYENQDGYNFKSLQTLYKQKEYGTYTFETKNINLPDDFRVQDMEKARWNVLKYEHIKNFDSLEEAMSGAFANRMISIDTLRLMYYVKDYDYNKDFPLGSSLNPKGIITNAKDRLGETANTKYESVLKVVTTNTGDFNDPYIKAHDTTATDYNIELAIPYRTAQVAQLNAHKMKITVPGDPMVKVGSVIIFNLPAMSTDPNRPMDKFFSGRYLVTAVRHKVDQENRFMTMMEISKESSPKAYSDFNNSLPGWADIRGR